MSIAIGNKIIAGNANVVNSDTLCNPNILTNSNFKIRTNGKSVYTNAGICMDTWGVGTSTSDTNFTLTPIDDGITVSVVGPDGQYIHIEQTLDEKYLKVDEEYTMTISLNGVVSSSTFIMGTTTHHLYIDGKVRAFYYNNLNTFGIRVYTGETVTINWAKIEKGSNQTMYIDPVPYLELLRCQGAVLNNGTSGFTSSFTNENMIHNPDFKINQRGKTVYTGDNVYGVDRWITSGCTVTPNKFGTLALAKMPGESFYTLTQYINYEDYNILHKYVTISIKIGGNIYTASGIPNDGITVNMEGTNTCVLTNNAEKKCVQLTIKCYTDCTIEWVKLELGVICTPFNQPDPATELIKCQRYYQLVNVNPILCIAMAANKLRTITALSTYMRCIPTCTLDIDPTDDSLSIKTATGTHVAASRATSITNIDVRRIENELNMILDFDSNLFSSFCLYTVFPTTDLKFKLSADL